MKTEKRLIQKGIRFTETEAEKIKKAPYGAGN